VNGTGVGNGIASYFVITTAIIIIVMTAFLCVVVGLDSNFCSHFVTQFNTALRGLGSNYAVVLVP